ncbi:hypothetical protein PENTCL1PPCAC_28615, partial [Pristionchus entomophagus]
LSLSPSQMTSLSKGLPPRKAFDTVIDSRVTESGHSLEVLLRHCVTGDTEWKDIKKCRNYSRTMFHDYFKTQTGQKEVLYKEWRKNVNKKRREAFAMAKNGLEKPERPVKLPKEIKEMPTPTPPKKEEPVFQTEDINRYVEDKVREVSSSLFEAERSRANTAHPTVQKAKADTTTGLLKNSTRNGTEPSNSGSDSDDERAHPGLLNKHDPLLNDAYYDYGRHGETRDVLDRGNNGNSGLASFSTAFSSFSSGGSYGSSYYDSGLSSELFIDRY